MQQAAHALQRKMSAGQHESLVSDYHNHHSAMDGGGHPPVAINQLGGTRRTPQIIDGGSGGARPPRPTTSSPRCKAKPSLNYKRNRARPTQGDFDPRPNRTRDLGAPFPLSSVCNPYYKHLSARAQELELNVGTFCPNQYKSLCLILAQPSKPVTRTQIY